jgi:arsenate reductase (thioredoxin)
MKEVIFICQGNVGRSQMAEGFYKHHAGAESAMSAGTADVGAKYNFVPREDIVQVMQEKGIDISEQRIKQITEYMLEEVRTVVVLCDPELLPDFVKTSGLNTLLREVHDPYESSIDGVREVRDQIEQIVLSLLSEQE